MHSRHLETRFLEYWRENAHLSLKEAAYEYSLMLSPARYRYEIAGRQADEVFEAIIPLYEGDNESEAQQALASAWHNPAYSYFTVSKILKQI